MPSKWFATIDLEQSSEAGRRALNIVTKALDQLMPTRLDRDRSKVGFHRSETFTLLAHQDTNQGDVYIAVYESGWTNLYGLHGHDEVYSSGDEWAVDLNESVNTILTGQYRLKLAGWRSPRTVLDYGCTTSG